MFGSIVFIVVLAGMILQIVKSVILREGLITFSWLCNASAGTLLFTLIASIFGFLNGLGRVNRIRLLVITNFRLIVVSYGALLFRRGRSVTNKDRSLLDNVFHKYEKRQIRSFEFDTITSITVLEGPREFAAISVASINSEKYQTPFLRKAKSLVSLFPENLNKNFEYCGFFKTYLYLILQKLSQENIGVTGNDF